MSARALADPVIWHDVECGAYTGDLELWEELAANAGDPVLELGCGTGRVAGHLAARGHAVTGVDRDPALIAALEERAGAGRHPVEAVCGDVRELQLDGRFALAIAPMQLAHLLENAPQRRRMLLSVRRHLEREGLAAFALLDHETLAVGEAERGGMLPDVCERDGWIFSSLPLSVHDHAEGVELRRLRQAVSPAGELTEEVDVTWLRALTAEQLEAEASSVGLRPAGRRDLLPTDAHAGSVVVLLRSHHGPGREKRR